ncbi:MAG: hypothetical protein JO348_03250 [Alphaproteobacteria bacterium]|nr:hypothetical protein [Alphaproteobacteria bacterium]MBV9418766.1 hypothetical protein [Alphaproteobacteria bacterium]
MMDKAIAWAVVAMLLLAGQPAAAEDCGLKQLAALDIVILDDGSLAVPVGIEGVRQLLVVAMERPHTALFSDFTRETKPRTRALPDGIIIGGVSGITTIDEFRIGSVVSKNVRVLRQEERDVVRADVVGYLANDILENFEVELDIAHRKLNLFDQAHCPGQLVYWTDAAAVVPFELQEGGAMSLSMELDGKPVTVAFGTKPGHGTIGLATAKHIGFDPAGHFKTLTMSGISINEPAIDVVDVKSVSSSMCKPEKGSFRNIICDGTEVQLGLDEFKGLRIMVSFKEKKLYITGADAH